MSTESFKSKQEIFGQLQLQSCQSFQSLTDVFLRIQETILTFKWNLLSQTIRNETEVLGKTENYTSANSDQYSVRQVLGKFEIQPRFLKSLSIILSENLSQIHQQKNEYQTLQEIKLNTGLQDQVNQLGKQNLFKSSQSQMKANRMEYEQSKQGLQFSMGLKGGGCAGSSQNVSNASLKEKIKKENNGKQTGKQPGANAQILATKEQKTYQEGLTLMQEGLNEKRMEKILQGFQIFKDNKFENINQPLGLCVQFVDIISNKMTEDWSQLLKEQIVRYLPELLDILLQKNQEEMTVVSSQTKSDLILKIKASQNLVNKDIIGGPELEFALNRSLMILENLPSKEETDYFDIFMKIIKVAQWVVALSFGVGAIDTEAMTIIKNFFVKGKDIISEKIHKNINLKIRCLEALAMDLCEKNISQDFVDFQAIVIKEAYKIRFRTCFLLQGIVKSTKANNELKQNSCKFLEQLCEDKD